MLQANNMREDKDTCPFEDYSIFMYRKSAPEFNERVKDLEKKLLYPVSDSTHSKKNNKCLERYSKLSTDP